MKHNTYVLRIILIVSIHIISANSFAQILPSYHGIHHYDDEIVTNGLTLYLDAANSSSYSGSGNTWTDLSGQNNHGTISGATYNNTNGGNFNFDGNDKVIIGNMLNNNAYTKIAWFRPESQTYNIISGDGNSRHAFWMSYSNHTLYAGHNRNDGNGGSWVLISNRPNDPGNMLNQWWFGAVTFDTNNGFILYVNGEQVNSYAGYKIAPEGPGYVQIGFFCCGAYFDGDIPVVKIYNRALSASEILSNYRALKSRYGH